MVVTPTSPPPPPYGLLLHTLPPTPTANENRSAHDGAEDAHGTAGSRSRSPERREGFKEKEAAAGHTRSSRPVPESELEARRRRKTRFEPATAAEVKALKYDTDPAATAGAVLTAPQRRRPQFKPAPVSHSWAAGALAWAAEAQTPRATTDLTPQMLVIVPATGFKPEEHEVRSTADPAPQMLAIEPATGFKPEEHKVR